MKIKPLLLPVILFFCCLLPGAQCLAQPEIEWAKCYGGQGGDFANSISQTTDGGYIIVGNSYSNGGDVSGNHGDVDYWVVKLDNSGTLQWQKSLGGTGVDKGTSVEETSDGGYIVAGYSGSNNGDVSGHHGGYDIWVIKLNVNGVLQWQKCFGGTGLEEAYSIIQTSDDGYLVAGCSQNNNGNVSGNHGGKDYWVVKLDSLGNLQWQRCLGGTNNEIAYAMQPTIDGGYVLAGVSWSNDGDVSGNHGAADYWIVKINSTGILQWQKSLGGNRHDEAHSIRQTSDGGFIAVGYSHSYDGDVSGNKGMIDCWVVKLDGSGNLQWQKSLGGTGNDYGYSIRETMDGEYVIAGFSQSNDGDVTGNHGNTDCWLVKIDENGNLQWQKSLGGTNNESATSIQLTTDGGYIMAGGTYSLDGDVTGNHGFGNNDFWIVKLKCTSFLPNITTSDTTTFCQGESITLSANNSANYQWSNGETTQSIVVNNSGSYFVYTLDSAGMHSCPSPLVEVVAVELDVNINPIGNAVLCEGNSVTLSANPNNGLTYLWLFNGVEISGEISDILSVDTIGNYYVMITDSNGCTALSPAINISSPTNPIISFSDNILESTQALSYQWYLNDTIIPGATSQNYQITRSGNYYVITVDVNGCIRISNTEELTYNSIDKVQHEKFSVYPNPGKSQFQLQLSQAPNATSVLAIFDITGSTIHRQNITSSNTSIDMTGHSRGVYLVEVMMEDGVWVGKVVVE